MQNIVIIGTGNVAEHLSKALFNRGLNIMQIFGRDLQKAQQLANKVKAVAINDIANLNQSADLYLLCVTDSALTEIINKITFQPNLVAHTAGSVSVNMLNKFDNYGVFYPLQTFTKDRDLRIDNVPFCIDANTDDNLKKLHSIASKISDKVFNMNDEKREKCHLAAVFACNFVNHFYSVATDILQNENIPFDILSPLIQETANKAIDNNPNKSQTGPAIRGDKQTMEKHINQLDEDLKVLYNCVSESIIKQHCKR